MEMGVFEALPADGSPASATALSEKLKVEKDLLGMLSPTNLHSKFNVTIIIFGNSSTHEEPDSDGSICRGWQGRICSHPIFSNFPRPCHHRPFQDNVYAPICYPMPIKFGSGH